MSITAAEFGASDDTVSLPDVLPSRLVARADEAFEPSTTPISASSAPGCEHAVAALAAAAQSAARAPRRGSRIDLRHTMRAARTTGWEPMRLVRTRRRDRPRRVVMLCDVSRSMQPYAAIYLHLMRAAAVRRTTIAPEVFAFSTSLTRLTPVLSHRSAEVALAQGQRQGRRPLRRHSPRPVGRALLSAPHGNALRGAVVVIASDGWDADAPEALAHAMARLRRRAALVVWLNPRAATHGFQPLAGSMAAALPYCDVFMPAHSLTGLRALFDVLSSRPAPTKRVRR